MTIYLFLLIVSTIGRRAFARIWNDLPVDEKWSKRFSAGNRCLFKRNSPGTYWTPLVLHYSKHLSTILLQDVTTAVTAPFLLTPEND